MKAIPSDHRPWPVPSRPWIMTMQWQDLAFLHWPLEPALLTPLLGPGLALDTFEGQAWLAVTPFRMTGVRPRGCPPTPGLSEFPELNVRTYVTRDGKPGVWFVSLDAGNSVAVWLARWTFHLPYYRARMSSIVRGDTISYESIRTNRTARLAQFVAQYRPASGVFRAHAGMIEHWLTERYCLYAARHDRLYRAEIHHAPWPLQRGTVEIKVNTMGEAAGIPIPGRPPLVHFARHLEVVAWMPERVVA